jgi:glycosyltransferase involved in cell wall biosynthesis
MIETRTIQNEKNTKVLRGRNIVCFSHDWSGDPLSKTHIVRVLARDNRVLWVNSIANRMPTVAKKDFSRIVKKLTAFTEKVKEVEPNIFVMNPLTIPAYGSAAVRGFNQKFLLAQIRRAMKNLNFQKPVNLVFNPAAGMVAGKLGEDLLVYYCVDEYTAFTGATDGLKKIENELFRKSDLVIVSAEKLLADKKRFNPNTFLIRHGVDYRHFSQALKNEIEVPAEIRDLPRPVIGFHGLLADWVDYELLKKTAEHFKNGSLVLIGKVSVDAARKIKILDDLPNVHLLGRKPYADLPAFCKGFDVALNPFEISELTLAANPLKVREYLAAGLPVVSTAIPEVEILGTCLIGTSHADFIRQIEIALENPGVSMERSESVKSEGWEARVEELRQIIGTRNSECGMRN